MERDDDNVIKLIHVSEVELRLAIHEAFRLGACWSSDRRSARYDHTYLQDHYAKKLSDIIERVRKKG